MEIHQLSVGAAYGDAISNEVVAVQRLLRQNYTSDYYACRIDPRIDAHHISSYEERTVSSRGANLLILHASVFDPTMHEFLEHRSEPLILRYHNMTPPEFFTAWDPSLADRLRRGRHELVALTRRTVLTICDSDYNATEARAMGFDPVVTVPIVRDTDLLKARRRTAPAFLPLPDSGPTVAFVGRLAPNKGHQRLLATFHILKTYLRPDAHLVIVGGTDIPRYEEVLRTYAEGLGLAGVIFAGRITNDDLSAVYSRADLFLSMSAHEGFGVPLVEAMSFGVPIVAWSTTAVPETVDGAGILLDVPDPTLAAEAALRILDDEGLRNRLRTAAERRLADFDPRITSAAFLRAVMSVV